MRVRARTDAMSAALLMYLLVYIWRIEAVPTRQHVRDKTCPCVRFPSRTVMFSDFLHSDGQQTDELVSL